MNAVFNSRDAMVQMVSLLFYNRKIIPPCLRLLHQGEFDFFLSDTGLTVLGITNVYLTDSQLMLVFERTQILSRLYFSQT